MLLIHGDCLSHTKTLEDSSIDSIVTSIPYNIGVTYKEYADTLPREDFLKFLSENFSQWKRVLSTGGSVFINVGSKPTSPYLPFEIIPLLRAAGLTLQNTFHWVKSISVGSKTTGHFKPISSPRFVNDCHEYIFHLSHSGAAPINRKAVGVAYEYKSNIARRGHTEDLRCRGNLWFVPYSTRQVKKAHPATYPVEIPLMCLKLLKGAKNVLDPFMGTGTTGLAARELGLDFIGIDVVYDYYLEAKRILEEQR